MLFLFFVLIFFLPSCGKIIIKDASIGSISKGDVGMTFYLSIENRNQFYYSINVQHCKCCEVFSKNDKDCDYMKIIGGELGTICPNETTSVSLLFPNMYLHNRKGWCDLVVDLKDARGNTLSISSKIAFNTYINFLKAPRILKGYHLRRGVRNCKTVDLDPLDRCQPVNCLIKYLGSRNYFNPVSQRCVEVPSCVSKKQKETPSIIYLPISNTCKNLKDTIKPSDIKTLESGNSSTLSTLLYASNIRCHKGKLDENTGICKCNEGWTSAPMNKDAYEPSLFQYHMCNIKKDSLKQQTGKKIKMVALFLAIFGIVLSLLFLMLSFVLGILQKYTHDGALDKPRSWSRLRFGRSWSSSRSPSRSKYSSSVLSKWIDTRKGKMEEGKMEEGKMEEGKMKEGKMDEGKSSSKTISFDDTSDDYSEIKSTSRQSSRKVERETSSSSSSFSLVQLFPAICSDETKKGDSKSSKPTSEGDFNCEKKKSAPSSCHVFYFREKLRGGGSKGPPKLKETLPDVGVRQCYSEPICTQSETESGTYTTTGDGIGAETSAVEEGKSTNTVKRSNFHIIEMLALEGSATDDGLDPCEKTTEKQNEADKSITIIHKQSLPSVESSSTLDSTKGSSSETGEDVTTQQPVREVVESAKPQSYQDTRPLVEEVYRNDDVSETTTEDSYSFVRNESVCQIRQRTSLKLPAFLRRFGRSSKICRQKFSISEFDSGSASPPRKRLRYDEILESDFNPASTSSAESRPDTGESRDASSGTESTSISLYPDLAKSKTKRNKRMFWRHVFPCTYMRKSHRKFLHSLKELEAGNEFASSSAYTTEDEMSYDTTTSSANLNEAVGLESPNKPSVSTIAEERPAVEAERCENEEEEKFEENASEAEDPNERKKISKIPLLLPTPRVTTNSEACSMDSSPRTTKIPVPISSSTRSSPRWRTWYPRYRPLLRRRLKNSRTIGSEPDGGNKGSSRNSSANRSTAASRGFGAKGKFPSRTTKSALLRIQKK